jgi:hypothetical protein
VKVTPWCRRHARSRRGDMRIGARSSPKIKKKKKDVPQPAGQPISKGGTNVCDFSDVRSALLHQILRHWPTPNKIYGPKQRCRAKFVGLRYPRPFRHAPYVSNPQDRRQVHTALNLASLLKSMRSYTNREESMMVHVSYLVRVIRRKCGIARNVKNIVNIIRMHNSYVSEIGSPKGGWECCQKGLM